MAYKNIAVAGASGNIGPSIVTALQNAGMNVTAITRASSNATFPAGVTVKKIDESGDGADAVDALKGIDVVISVVSAFALKKQPQMIDAAVKAGVKMFLPAEFGSNWLDVKEPASRVFEDKVATIEYLKKTAAANPGFTWCGISCSWLMDLSMKNGSWPIDVNAKTARIYGSGDIKFATTNMPTLAKAVVSALQNPEKSANKYLIISGITLTQNEVLKMSEEKTGSKFAITNIPNEGLAESGFQKMAKGDVWAGFAEVIFSFLFGNDGITEVSEENNALNWMGVPKDDLSATLDLYIQGKL